MDPRGRQCVRVSCTRSNSAHKKQNNNKKKNIKTKIRSGFLSLFLNHSYYFIAAGTCRLNRSIKNTRVDERVRCILNGVINMLAYVWEGHRTDTCKDTVLTMIMMIFTNFKPLWPLSIKSLGSCTAPKMKPTF